MLGKSVRVFDPEEVTTQAEEVPPNSVGLRQDDVEAIWKAVVRLYKTGLHPAIALCMRREGQVIIDRAIGHSSGNQPGAPKQSAKELATPDTLYNLFSASKAVTAMLIHLLDERRELHLDDRIAEFIPEFGTDSKRHMTIRHVLTHRAGIPNIKGVQSPLDLMTDREAILRILGEAKLTGRPGRHLAYHALSGGFILGEIIERVTGLNARELLDREIRKPLGFEGFSYGVPARQVSQVAEHAYTGPAPVKPYSWLLERSLGVDIREAVHLSNDPRFLTGIIPSGNIISTPNETTRFFEMLLRGGELDGVRIFDPRTVRRAISETSYLELDTTLMLPVRYGMGFMLGGQYLSFYGPDTPKAFGHLGFTNVLAYADPQRDITVCLMNTGKPFVTIKLLLWLNIMRVIAKRIPKTSD